MYLVFIFKINFNHLYIVKNCAFRLYRTQNDYNTLLCFSFIFNFFYNISISFFLLMISILYNEMVHKSSRYTHLLTTSSSPSPMRSSVPPLLPGTTASVSCQPFCRKPQLYFSTSRSNTKPANLDHQRSSSFSFSTIKAKHGDIEVLDWCLSP